MAPSKVRAKFQKRRRGVNHDMALGEYRRKRIWRSWLRPMPAQKSQVGIKPGPLLNTV